MKRSFEQGFRRKFRDFIRLILQEWQKAEIAIFNKVKKKWIIDKNELQQEGGIWQTNENPSETTQNKIDETEDFLRRRIRLKKYNKMQEEEHSTFDLNQPRFKPNKDSITMFSDQNQNESHSTFTSMISTGLGFNNINKEEMLSTIQEDTSYHLDGKSRILNVTFRAACERVSLKGTVYGYIEIVDAKKILFSPSLYERPADKSFPFGALVSKSETLFIIF